MTDSTERAVRAVAYLEATKGVLVLLAATGLLSLLHEDFNALAQSLLVHVHVNPAAHYPKIFLEAASSMNDTRLLWIAAGALVYSTLRFVESWGLFRGMAWAEMLGAVSAAIYVPFEVVELVHAASWYSAILLTLNLLIVYVMVRALRAQRARYSV